MRVCRFSNPIPSLFPPQSPRSTGGRNPKASEVEGCLVSRYEPLWS